MVPDVKEQLPLAASVKLLLDVPEGTHVFGCDSAERSSDFNLLA